MAKILVGKVASMLKEDLVEVINVCTEVEGALVNCGNTNLHAKVRFINQKLEKLLEWLAVISDEYDSVKGK